MSAECDYCGEKFDQSAGTITTVDGEWKHSDSEQMTIRFPNDKELHFECWVMKRWVERGWIDEPPMQTERK